MSKLTKYIVTFDLIFFLNFVNLLKYIHILFNSKTFDVKLKLMLKTYIWSIN